MKKYMKPMFEVTQFENDEDILKLSSAKFNGTKNSKISGDITYTQLGLQ
jgi:hypothetical protein